MREGKCWQCPKPARKGTSVCGPHGGGYPIRERRGERKNPMTASVTTGRKAKPSTMQALAEELPQLGAMTRANLEDPHLEDLRPQLAQAKALHQLYVERAAAELKSTGTGNALLRAIESLRTIASLSESVIKVRQGMNAPTREELARFKHAVLMTFEKFVPAELYDDAERFLREALAGDIGLARRVLPVAALIEGGSAKNGPPGSNTDASAGGGALPTGN